MASVHNVEETLKDSVTVNEEANGGETNEENNGQDEEKQENSRITAEENHLQQRLAVAKDFEELQAVLERVSLATKDCGSFQLESLNLTAKEKLTEEDVQSYKHWLLDHSQEDNFESLLEWIELRVQHLSRDCKKVRACGIAGCKRSESQLQPEASSFSQKGLSSETSQIHVRRIRTGGAEIKQRSRFVELLLQVSKCLLKDIFEDYIKLDKSTTKICVVFDAAMKYNGKSLNDVIRAPVALSGDISEMFLQRLMFDDLLDSTSAGFNLRKWASNETAVIESIAPSVMWEAKEDVFTFQVKLPESSKPLKKHWDHVLPNNLATNLSHASRMAFATVAYLVCLYDDKLMDSENNSSTVKSQQKSKSTGRLRKASYPDTPVSDSDSFINAFVRMVSRRGTPSYVIGGRFALEALKQPKASRGDWPLGRILEAYPVHRLCPLEYFVIDHLAAIKSLMTYYYHFLKCSAKDHDKKKQKQRDMFQAVPKRSAATDTNGKRQKMVEDQEGQEVDSDINISDSEKNYDSGGSEGEYDSNNLSESNSLTSDQELNEHRMDTVDHIGCSCIEEPQPDEVFDTDLTGNVDPDDLFTVHVAVENADPLCIKIQDLTHGGKISKDKFFYKYLGDVVEIMYNPFHKYDREVVEFFNMITYLGGRRTACFIRGPMNLGDSRNSHVSLTEKKMNLGGPSETI
ncbi:Hypothetical predicted protein [Paramuricea clavata]|uniref:Uncharacterized protein n=1 Tax=Paramuricea clavata TaxID=317549 RepID=A0A6S7JSE9_PARCT|nr:Hypothetical predicted protein [Paramuricea clavata]